MKKIFLSFILLTTDISWASKTIKLKFLQDINFKTGTIFEDSEVGGFSALNYNNKTKKLIILSDDRGNRNSKGLDASRFYKYDLKMVKGRFSLTPSSVTKLKINAKGYSFLPYFLDPEGMVQLSNGEFLISSEGFNPIIPTSIIKFSVNAVYKEQIEIPTELVAHYASGKQISGIQNNAGLESLTISKDKTTLWAAVERPLIQDFKKNKRYVRILEFVSAKDKYSYKKIYKYPLTTDGLAEMIMLNKTDHLMLERGFNGVSTILLYQTNFNTTEGLLKKKLVLNLNYIIPKLSKKYPLLDNFEAMTLGPKLANGNDTLIIASDNNFNRFQRTAFFIFEIIR